MNDIQNHMSSDTPRESQTKLYQLWNKIFALLSRDIRLFFQGNKTKEQPENLQFSAASRGALEPVLPLIEPLVDFNKLPYMAFRREVLDWRDNFHADVSKTLKQLENSFIQQMDAELNNTSAVRKLITRPASEVLQDSFIRTVRMPLITALRKEEAYLNACAQKWALFGKVELVIDIRVLSSECASLHEIGFKPANRSLIVSGIQALLWGPERTAEHFHDQGLQISRRLLEAKASC